MAIVGRKKPFFLLTSYHAVFLLSLSPPRWKKPGVIFSFFFSFGATARLTCCCPPCPDVLHYFPALRLLFCQWGIHRVCTPFPHFPTNLTAFLHLRPPLSVAHAHTTPPLMMALATSKCWRLGQNESLT